jgi:probable phosphoglycerate mutase
MKLYFVRHGETNSNLQKNLVSFSDELTDNGREQAQQLAERIFTFSIDIIIASPHKRNEETAQIIAKTINKTIQFTPLLGEKKWPSELEGKPLKDLEVEKFFELSREKNNSEPNWHYSDEENFVDIKKRADLFIKYISGLAYENILVVSHEYFIKMIIAMMMHGNQLSYEVFKNFFSFTSLNNTSLTLCEKKEDSWKLITFNDQQHLA